MFTLNVTILYYSSSILYSRSVVNSGFLSFLSVTFLQVIKYYICNCDRLQRFYETYPSPKQNVRWKCSPGMSV